MYATRDSNPQPPDSKSDTLSIAPAALHVVQEAERVLGGVQRYVSSNLALHGSGSSSAACALSFSADEEQALEQKVSEGIAAYHTALASAQDWAQELPDPKQAADAARALDKHQKQLQSLAAACRKALVAYRQRAKLERLEQQRRSLLPRSAEGKAAASSSSSAGSAVDVTAALKRTRQVMSQEIERVSSVTKVLDDGRLSLRSSHEEYGSVNAEIVEVRKRLKALEWQARQDKMWIGAGIAVLLSTVLFIVHLPLRWSCAGRGHSPTSSELDTHVPSTTGHKSTMPPAANSNDLKLVGHKNFVRHNPQTDRFDVHKFHHIEFFCLDATNVSRRFSWGLGMGQIGKSDQSTGNHVSASYVIQSGDVKLVFTAPYALETDKAPDAVSPVPGYDAAFAQQFVLKHGLAVRALGIQVADAKAAYEISVQNGGEGVLEPQTLTDKDSGKSTVISEVKLYGDVVIRWVSGDFEGPLVPGYEKVDGPDMSIGIQRMDHCVGNVPSLLEAVKYITGFTGFHEFAEFTAEDVGTLDSGLNSMVLASNNEMVLLPVNEPTFGTKRKSQIQTYLEQNFMPRPNAVYYEQMPERIGESLTKEQYKMIEQLGLLVDKDDQGILLQIFTKPLGDRATVFFEIIERVGCMKDIAGRLEQAAGCGGFGKGNFSALFKSIEDYEKSLNV
ncbi:unnamed protein product [Phytophthora fragariaefolia]|uniref:4-hydroxyphenylpyruvate dioxygenase n=1 Tax=Phytophthora fragariaefolia TaxID=1490495 RepID=A0A9W7D099_9STRA|nr:unnamed protein product [Phytophthora fragariaefolia]